jgi:uncharacterized membrane protein YgcG
MIAEVLLVLVWAVRQMLSKSTIMLCIMLQIMLNLGEKNHAKLCFRPKVMQNYPLTTRRMVTASALEFNGGGGGGDGGGGGGGGVDGV